MSETSTRKDISSLTIMYSVVIRNDKSLRESAHFFNEGRMEMVGKPALGGMENAFCNNFLRRMVDFFAGRLIIHHFWHAPRPVKQGRERKRICRRSGDTVSGAWGILPTELLVSILIKLSIVDYLSFSGVCKSWRSASIDFRKYCMEHQQPLIVVRPKYSKKSCVLYNMFDMKSYKTMLPDLPCKKLLGLSCGYLITIDRNLGFWLVNLMTKHELRFPFLRGMGDRNFFEFSARLFRSTRLSETFMILFSLRTNYIFLSKSGGSSWQRYVLFDTKARIADVKIFYGKIFVLTSDARLGEFNPKAGSVPKFSKISIPFQVSSNMYVKLVASDNKLYMTVLNNHPYPGLDQYLSLFEIDHETMDRAKQIHDLGAKSLFLSWFSSAVVDTTGWGAGNCVCLLQFRFLNACSFFNLNGNWLGTTPVVWDGYFLPYFWYFPSEIWSVSCVSDEFGA
ncbi:uncharacterized protein LOC135150175 [Daucus carota subsp. sativus]|uniref:uncharacterized protein LOC135150175 n=1 Tax=Daucus carota subsp. sativus TaxID=79200 RepID=UPI003082B382